MAVTAFGFKLTPARATALGVSTTVPIELPKPHTPRPGVCLFSSVAGWSGLYEDDGTLTPAAWASDPIFALDVQLGNDASLRSLAIQALASNATYVALAAPSTAQNTAQIKLLTREVSALIRLFLQQLDSLTGT